MKYIYSKIIRMKLKQIFKRKMDRIELASSDSMRDNGMFLIIKFKTLKKNSFFICEKSRFQRNRSKDCKIACTKLLYIKRKFGDIIW